MGEGDGDLGEGDAGGDVADGVEEGGAEEGQEEGLGDLWGGLELQGPEQDHPNGSNQELEGRQEPREGKDVEGFLVVDVEDYVLQVPESEHQPQLQGRLLLLRQLRPGGGSRFRFSIGGCCFGGGPDGPEWDRCRGIDLSKGRQEEADWVYVAVYVVGSERREARKRMGGCCAADETRVEGRRKICYWVIAVVVVVIMVAERSMESESGPGGEIQTEHGGGGRCVGIHSVTLLQRELERERQIEKWGQADPTGEAGVGG